jgi:regulator of protease activity HflC (stomatin/prohibitin superfamily)
MDTDIPIGIFVGFIIWFVLRYLASGFYTVNQNERAVKTNFGRADRIPDATTLTSPAAAQLDPEEKQRYQYPQVRVIMPGGPYFKWPWQKIHKVSIATQTVNMAHDPEAPDANQSGKIVEAVMCRSCRSRWPRATGLSNWVGRPRHADPRSESAALAPQSPGS